MKLSHFKRYFVMICVASPVPDFGDSFKTTPLNTYVLCNSWKSGRSAGGSNLEDEEFLKNPQYTLIVPKPGFMAVTRTSNGAFPVKRCCLSRGTLLKMS
ncbi:Protein of unknown function, partial [Gryllus bimaculatus]